jgi:hypothetical protein
MQFGKSEFVVTMSSLDPSKQAARLLSTLLYTALAESAAHLPTRRFTLLLTVKAEPPQVEIGVVSHIEAFFEKYRNLAELLVSGDDAGVAARVEAASSTVHRTKVELSPGRLVVHEVALHDNTFSLQPLAYAISMPKCSTSELLVALSAVINGCILAIDHNGPMEYQDRLLQAYLERAKLGEPLSLDDFEYCDDDPESWFLT